MSEGLSSVRLETHLTENLHFLRGSMDLERPGHGTGSLSCFNKRASELNKNKCRIHETFLLNRTHSKELRIPQFNSN